MTHPKAYVTTESLTTIDSKQKKLLARLPRSDIVKKQEFLNFFFKDSR